MLIATGNKRTRAYRERNANCGRNVYKTGLLLRLLVHKQQETHRTRRSRRTLQTSTWSVLGLVLELRVSFLPFLCVCRRQAVYRERQYDQVSEDWGSSLGNKQQYECSRRVVVEIPVDLFCVCVFYGSYWQLWQPVSVSSSKQVRIEEEELSRICLICVFAALLFSSSSSVS